VTLGLAMALAVLTIGRMLWATWRAEHEWARIGSALLATGVPGPSGVTVVPLATPTAFVAGDRIVISAALLDTLDPTELEAVLAHETAHLRGRHPRIAAWAHALSQGSFRIPPARAAESRVRQQLELLADRHVVDTLHDPEPIRAAITKLTGGATGGPPRLDIGQVTHERLRCLLLAPSSTASADRLVTITTAALAAILVAVVCGALHVHLAGLGLAVCGLTVAGLSALLWPLHRPV
jgi:Zn-dependent protease with chaperone function